MSYAPPTFGKLSLSDDSSDDEDNVNMQRRNTKAIDAYLHLLILQHWMRSLKLKWRNRLL